MKDLNDFFEVEQRPDKRYNEYRGFASLMRRDPPHPGFDYESKGVLKRHVSGYILGNYHVTSVLEYIDKLVIRLINSVKYIRNINNFYVDDDYNGIN